jgi:hypothetical protein
MRANADFRTDLTQACFELTDSWAVSHTGVSVDVIIQEIDVTGSTTFVANQTLDLHTMAATTKRCVALHALKFETRFGGIQQNASDLQHNALPWNMRITAEFDADVRLLAFPDVDNITLRDDRKDLTWAYGVKIVSPTEIGSLAPHTSGPRDVPRCGALSLLQKDAALQGGSSRNRC